MATDPLLTALRAHASAHDLPGTSHWDGCYTEHVGCALALAVARLTDTERVLLDVLEVALEPEV